MNDEGEMIMENYIIEMNHITKIFPGIKALDDVTIQLKKGEILALLGENGAGKSTLMSVLFGLYQAEEGSISMNGKPVKINDPNDATRMGIGMVHQHFKLVHNFTVLENIVLGAEEKKKGLLYLGNARKKVKKLSKDYGLNVDTEALISDITVGMQQRVEILKMLYRDNEILIFDEPTAVLTPQEIEELMKIMKDLAKEGKSIIFITHKLNEIKQVADRCVVLRKGKYIGTVNVADTSKEQLSEMMVGRKVNFKVDKKDKTPGKDILRVEHLTLEKKGHKNLLNDINLHVREGEIVCVAGIDGNGQSELVYALTGIMNPTSGTILLNDQDITHTAIRKRNDAGLGCIPEDRHKHGLVLDYSLQNNMVLKSYYKEPYSKHGFFNFKAIEQYANKLIDMYDVRCGQGGATNTRSMSGGNQQKAIVAREIEENPQCLIAVQPTRGLDVGAIEYIHKKIVEERDSGRAVLLVSLELDEVMNLSDRIYVIYEGEFVGELDPKKTTIQELGLYMSGSKREGNHE